MVRGVRNVIRDTVDIYNKNQKLNQAKKMYAFGHKW